MRVTLDANVLVYAFHAIDPRTYVARDLVSRALQADCVLTLQSLGEFINVLSRKRKLPIRDVYAEVERLKACVPVTAAGPADLEDAVWAVAEHNFSFWDGLLWATARRAGCRTIFSEDMQDGRQLGSVRIINPFKPENDHLVDFVLPRSDR